MSGQPASKLSLAILRCLPSDGSAISHSELRARLIEDVWASRNQHRLARVDSTLALMSQDGRLTLNDAQVALIVSPDGTVAEAVKDGFAKAAKAAGFKGPARTFPSSEGDLAPLSREQARRLAGK